MLHNHWLEFMEKFGWHQNTLIWQIIKLYEVLRQGHSKLLLIHNCQNKILNKGYILINCHYNIMVFWGPKLLRNTSFSRECQNLRHFNFLMNPIVEFNLLKFALLKFYSKILNNAYTLKIKILTIQKLKYCISNFLISNTFVLQLVNFNINSLENEFKIHEKNNKRNFVFI